MRLIDADEIDFNKAFGGKSGFAKDMREAAQMLVDKQPTAFDVEKVIEQLKECIESPMNGANDVECAYWNRGIEKAIKIVRGGIDENNKE